MSRILCVTWSGGGNQPPMIGLAQQLRRQGHEIIIAGYADQAARFGALGFKFATLTRSGAALERFDPSELMRLLVTRVWACPDHLADTAELLDRHRPDLVVVDCLMGGVLAALETGPIPAVALVHSAPGALAPPGGPTDHFILGDLNSVRSGAALDPVDSVWEAWQRHRVICASIPELDPLASDTPRPFTWIGPVFEDLTTTDWTADDRNDLPLILVSFSSGVAWDQTSRIQRSMDGLAHAGVRVVVTTGAVDPARLHVPPGSITVVPYIPHAAILPHAAAVVTHAGHGTLVAALAHGLPVVAIPNLAADQPALAEQLERVGAGIHLDQLDATPGGIAHAVRTVLDEPAYSTNARALADRIQSYRDRACAAILSLLDKRGR